jgi:4-aminobutyrate aminotransferase-like enzyme
VSLLAGIAIDHGEGATLTDADGNVYVDFFAGIAVASLGHGHPGLAQAISRQASRLMVGTLANAERAEAFKLLSEVAPGNLKRAHLYSGGAEAVEAALRLARSKTKKFEVVSFWGGFHGKTGGVIGHIGDEWKQGYGPLPGRVAASHAPTSRGSRSRTVLPARYRQSSSSRFRAPPEMSSRRTTGCMR